MPEKFSDRLRKTRLDRGLSQADLAKRAGLQPAAISHFETEERSPSFENLRRLADALEISIDYLLVRTPEPESAGPVVDRLYRDFRKMSAEDQDTIAKMAEMLARKNTEKR